MAALILTIKATKNRSVTDLFLVKNTLRSVLLLRCHYAAIALAYNAKEAIKSCSRDSTHCRSKGPQSLNL